jgi:hypothetical protein
MTVSEAPCTFSPGRGVIPRIAPPEHAHTRGSTRKRPFERPPQTRHGFPCPAFTFFFVFRVGWGEWGRLRLLAPLIAHAYARARVLETVRPKFVHKDRVGMSVAGDRKRSPQRSHRASRCILAGRRGRSTLSRESMERTPVIGNPLGGEECSLSKRRGGPTCFAPTSVGPPLSEWESCTCAQVGPYVGAPPFRVRI